MDNEMNTLMAEGGLKTDGATTDPVSGNDVPTGSNAEEVRDDIPAQLSDGEYVVPADVVKFFGVQFFEKLREKAKSGLADMETDGRIGGDDGTEDDSLPFGVDELQTEDDGMDAQMQDAGFATGGAVTGNPTPADIEANRSTFNPAGYPIGFSVFGNTAPAATQPAATTSTKVYVNKQGQTIVIPFDANGNPTIPIPAGYTLQTAANTGASGSGGGSGGEGSAQNATPPVGNSGGKPGDTGRIKLEDFASEDALIASGLKDIEQMNSSKKAGGIAGSLLGGGIAGGLVGSLVGEGWQLSELRAKIQLADKYGMTKAAEALRAAEAESGLKDKFPLASGNMLTNSFYKKNPTIPTTAVKPDGTVGAVAGTGTGSGGGGGGTAPKPTTPVKATGTVTTKGGTNTATKPKVGVTTKAGTGTITSKSGSPISVKGSITTGTKPSTPSPKNTKGKATGGLMQKSKK